MSTLGSSMTEDKMYMFEHWQKELECMTTTDIDLESRIFCRLVPNRLFGWFVWCLTALTAQIGYIVSCPARNIIL